MAGPVPPEQDLAFLAFAWVPLHATHLAAREGFTAVAARPHRLRRFLAAYGWDGTLTDFLGLIHTRLAREGIPANPHTALTQLAHFRC